MLVRALNSAGGGGNNSYAESVGSDIQIDTVYTINCGFEPNYVRIAGISSRLGAFTWDYMNGSKYEGYIGQYRATNNLTVTTNPTGCVIKYSDAGWETLSNEIVMCARL